MDLQWEPGSVGDVEDRPPALPEASGPSESTRASSRGSVGDVEDRPPVLPKASRSSELTRALGTGESALIRFVHRARMRRIRACACIVKHRINRVLAFAFFWLLPQLVGRAGVDFPASLLCMVALTALLLMLGCCGKGSWAQGIFNALQPGQQFLVKWTAVFFLPTLVELPVELGDSLSAGDVARLLILLVAGWLVHFSLLIGISAVLTEAMRRLSKARRGDDLPVDAQRSIGSTETDGWEMDSMEVCVELDMSITVSMGPAAGDFQRKPLPPKWPVNPAFLPAWGLGLVAGLVLGQWWPMAGECIFLMSACVFGTTVAGLFPTNAKLILAPVLVALVFTFAAIALWCLWIGSSFISVCGRFNRGDVMHAAGGLGAGQILMSCIPAFVVSLSLVVYQHRRVLWQNMGVIAGTSVCGVLLGLFGSSALAAALGLPPDLARPAGVRFFTAPLAMQSAEALETSATMAASYAVASGLVGATIGWPWVTKVCRVRDTLRVGTCIGCSSHGQGTAMLATINPEATAFSSVSFVLTGVLGALLVRVPLVQDCVVSIIG